MARGLCLTCGDIGYKTELVSCFKCLEAAIHKYCMRVMPKKKDSVVWLCEECEEAETLSRSRKRVRMVFDSDCDDEIVIKELKKNRTGDKKISEGKRKRDRTGDKKISEEKLKKDRTGDKGTSGEKTGDKKVSEEKLKKDRTGDKGTSREKQKKDQTGDKGIPREKPKKDQTGDEKISREKPKKDGTGDEEISGEKLKKDQTEKAILGGKLEKDHAGDKEISRKKSKPNPTDDDEKISTKELRKHQSEDKGLMPEKHEVKEESKQLHSSNTSPEPLIRSFWTGNFIVRNNKESTYTRMYELSAYLSSKACRNVCNEAARFRPVLELEMVPKSQVWPKHFEGTGPTDNSIGVYFFPSLMKYEQIYDYLVFEMIRNDIALRASGEKAELLIFTSVELPLQFRRFQGKLYLWGVFREY